MPYNKALLSDKFPLRSKFAAERGVRRKQGVAGIMLDEGIELRARKFLKFDIKWRPDLLISDKHCGCR